MYSVTTKTNSPHIWNNLQNTLQLDALVPFGHFRLLVEDLFTKELIVKRTLPRAGRPAKLSNWGRRALVRALDKEVTKNPMVSLTEL